ncbi:FadR/GntR family transcriptional regulator [Subtercola sp. YIM 133946]|uniref:FadR/GntR family transcriptional regulator n=1 Tax=Subtercola sp. YIM 133946 TaxID=3118909 RepID=UPI002F92BEC9
MTDQQFDPQPLERRDASGQIARQLRSAISTGVWAVGQQLPTEQELAELFDVARATAREALKILSATGLVTSARGSRGGTFVAVPEASLVAEQLSDSIQLWYRAGNVSLQDVDEARWVLEMQCVDLAARRRTDDDLAAISRPVEASRDLDMDIVEWLDLDLEFHTAVTRAARNQILELSMMSVHLMRPVTNTVFVELLDRQSVTDQHEAIYLAIAAGDPKKAQDAFQTHVSYLDDVRRKALADVDASEVIVSSLPAVRHSAGSRPISGAR